MTHGSERVDEALDLSHRLQADSVGRTLSLVGDRWTIMILRETFFGVRRYGQFARNLKIPRPTLSLRLRKLVDAGLLERVMYARDPDRFEYRLTDAGRDLFNAVIALIKTDPHSQPQARAMGTVVNQPGFYQAFDVKEGDKMYRAPDQRVTIW